MFKVAQTSGLGLSHVTGRTVQYLVRSLIQLEEFEEARERIQELHSMERDDDLVKPLTAECALLEGEVAQAKGNHERAKECFREAIENRSIKGCYHMAVMLSKNQDISDLNFRIDCGKILHCCELNNRADTYMYQNIKKLLQLHNAIYGKLRNRHFHLEQAILHNSGTEVTSDTLDNASQVMYEARTMLDRVMISFREKHYPSVKGNCTFFHVQQDKNNEPKTDEQIRDEILKRVMKNYKWKEFDVKFPDLLEYLVKVNFQFHFLIP